VAPRVIRPAEKLKISCTIMNKYWDKIMVKALIFTQEQEIASGVQEFLTKVTNTIAIMVIFKILSENRFILVNLYINISQRYQTISDKVIIV